MLRDAVYAGSFYPGGKSALAAEVRGLLGAGGGKKPFRGALIPHAGYRYSGGTAGAVYAGVELPESVVVLGPNHTGRGAPGAVAARGAWRTPLGDTPVDSELAEALIRECSCLAEDYLAHESEHSIEVHLPFLRFLRPDIRFVPVALSEFTLDECREIARAVASAAAGCGRDAAVIASSDMSHYEPEERARKKDALALEAVLSLDEEKLLEVVKKHRVSMCGCVPAAVMIAACRAAGPGTARLVSYSTSGAVSGDYSSVVGYAGVVLD